MSLFQAPSEPTRSEPDPPLTLDRATSRVSAATNSLFSEREFAQITLDSIGDAVLCTDARGNVVYVNPVCARLTGYQIDQARGRPLTEVFNAVDGVTHQPGPNMTDLAVKLDTTLCLPANSVLVRRDGTEIAIEDSTAPIHDQRGAVVGAVIVFRDVSASRLLATQLAHSAQHDVLTGMPNRTLLNDRLSHGIDLARRHAKRLAVLFLDLDAFKHINDSLGHTIGDLLLQSVAARLQACARSSDTVSRQGGDEFVILLPDIAHAEDAAHKAEVILAALAAPHIIDGRELIVCASIGVSMYPEDGLTAETLLQNADTAMYDAKEQGRNTLRFFRGDLNVRAVERQSIEADLRQALVRGEFILHYQPQFNLTTGVVSSVEALLRWRHPRLGTLPPARFLSIAEDCGLIVPIGRWVLREACAQMKRWLEAGLAPDRMAVNVCALEFRKKEFLADVQRALTDAGLPASRLELELTESVLMTDAESTTTALHALSALGVRIAVDDFGTGYSSLSYLKRFPIDALKIDKAFVQDLGAGSDGATIVGAIIALGLRLKYRVVAEGVETAEQEAFLRAEACSEVQGFLFSPPLAAGQVQNLMRTSAAAH